MTEEMIPPELMTELAALRRRVAELEAREKQTSTALRQSEITQRAILEAMPDLMFRLSREGVFLDFNAPQFTDLIAPPDKFLGKKATEVLPPELAQQIMVAIERTFQTGKGQIVEYQLPLQGEIRDFEARLVHSGSDEVLIIVRNITDHKQAERALRQSEERYRQAMAQAVNAIFIINQAGVIQSWNQACINLFQYDLEIIGQSYHQLLWNAADSVTLDRMVAQVFEAKQSFKEVEISYHTREGDRRLTNSRLYPILDREGNVKECVLSNTDITSRKHIEAALRESETRLRRITDHMLDMIGQMDLNGLVQYASPSFKKILGYHPHLLLGQAIFDFIHPDDLERLTANLEKSIQTHSDSQTEFRFRHAEGHYLWVEANSNLIFDDDNQMIGFVFASRDITERKLAEETLRLQNEQLQARNQELDGYARTVAHDLKNPLATLTTMAEVLAEDYTRMPSEQLDEYLQSIVRSGRKAGRIVEGLLLLAGVRQQTVTRQPLDMAGIVAETQERLTEMIREYQAEITSPPAWPSVLGYAPWVEEVWTNYLSNGLKYGGQPPRLELGAHVQTDEMVRFWVKDNGPGLTPEAQAQLFTEFTQLDPNRSEGYGLGLSIVRRIVEKLGGQVAVESEGIPGQGSTFSFTLPLTHP